MSPCFNKLKYFNLRISFTRRLKNVSNLVFSVLRGDLNMKITAILYNYEFSPFFFFNQSNHSTSFSEKITNLRLVGKTVSLEDSCMLCNCATMLISLFLERNRREIWWIVVENFTFGVIKLQELHRWFYCDEYSSARDWNTIRKELRILYQVIALLRDNCNCR